MSDEGISILRVDERVVGGTEAKFAEDEVRTVMTYDRAPDERKKYIHEIARVCRTLYKTVTD